MPASLPDRISRLVALHNTLIQAWAEEHPGVRIQGILESMDCERKTLYKCAEELRRMGAPIEYDRSNFTWRYREMWSFPLQVVSPVTGAVGIRLAMDFLLDPDLTKGLKDSIALDPKLCMPNNGTLPRLTGVFPKLYLGRLSSAIRERKVVRFEYRKPHGEVDIRELEPLDIFEWNGMPYLQGRSHLETRSPIKRFALSRIHKLEILDSRFRQTPKRQIPSCLGAFCGNVFTAIIVADAQHAPYVRERRWHPSQRNTEREDGSIEFKLPFGDLDEAARWLLGHGDGFCPTAPPELVGSWKAMIARLHKATNYEIEAPPAYPQRITERRAKPDARATAPDKNRQTEPRRHKTAMSGIPKGAAFMEDHPPCPSAEPGRMEA
jgi:predicted DNA-binding transcriptional regulator YafY